LDERGDLYRKSLRLAGHDYKSDGAYFITIVSHARKCIFGDVIKDKIILSTYGEIAQAEWFASKDIRKEIELFNDELVIMPNHLHGIVWIFSNPNDFMLPKTTSKVRVGATGRSPLPSGGKLDAGLPSKSLGAFIAGYKSSVTREINKVCGMPGEPIWKRNYHDRIIRNERELKAIRDYIINNPLQWEIDQYYSASTL
jgi:REP element-mobilizing transposase RayT